MRAYARFYFAAAVPFVLLLAPASLRPQSVSEIVAHYGAENERRLEGVDNVLLVQSVMGMSSELYMEKVESNGSVMLQPRVMRTQGMTIPLQPGASDAAFLGDPSVYLFEFADEAELRGTELVDGVETTVLSIEDLTGVAFGLPGLSAQQDMEVRSLRLFVDTEDWVIRRMEASAEVTTPGGPSEATLRADLTDFRATGEFIHPFRIVASIGGMGSGVSSAEIEQARRFLEEMEEQLEEMPAGQRQVVQQIMDSQMQNLLDMLASDSITVEIDVQEVRLNEGAPGA